MADLGIHDLFNVNNMIFIITGGGSGLGEWMALALDKNGASKVFILGRRMESLKKVAAKAVNGTLVPISCDISDKDSLKTAVTEIEKQTPYVNAVIANSGVLGPVSTPYRQSGDKSITSIQEELWNISLDDTRKTMDINVLGTFHTFVAFMHLLEAGNTHPQSRGKTDFIQSQFITVGSVAALSRQGLTSHMYAAGKAGVNHLTKTLATWFAKRGIRVNSIAPGLFITEMTEFFVTNGQDWTKPGSLPVDEFPMTRTGTAMDIGGAILFLTSKAGSYVNGNVLVTDGGMITIQESSY
ncbi:short chain dehydrogenase/reductase family [Lojkania enalia]|uniref:Short chain dehydrogenase/reductase family n=1 Tax=Lojkania enalia TaxID=147567 RepID=A0A9P4KJ82_9PLEO|nr:short chain dehydrogenase/reductase family [Didymosphaeria enalia]